MPNWQASLVTVYIRSSRSYLASVSGAHNPEKILHYRKDNTKSFSTAHSEASNSDMRIGISKKPVMVEKERQTTEYRRSFLSGSELQWVVATELRNVNSFALKSVIT